MDAPDREPDMSAEALLKNMIEKMEAALCQTEEQSSDQFVLGKRYAYVECLDIIQRWEKARQCGLDYDIEKRYNIH